MNFSKKLIVFSLLILSFLLFLSSSPLHAAINCEGFNINYNEGDPTTTFEIEGFGCNSGATYTALFDNEASGETVASQSSTANAAGHISFQFVGIPEGTYVVSVGVGLNTAWETTVVVNPGEAPTSFNCGDVLPASSEIDTSLCPTDCPARESVNTGSGDVFKWHCSCGDVGQGACAEGNTMGFEKGCRSGQTIVGGLCTVPVNYFAGSCDPETGKTDAGGEGILTAIGCIPIGLVNKFSGFFITWGLGVGGGFSILVFIAAAFMFITSSGDPTKLNMAKDLVISAITGIIFLVFSIFLLRLIGVNVLGLF